MASVSHVEAASETEAEELQAADKKRSRKSGGAWSMGRTRRSATRRAECEREETERCDGRANEGVMKRRREKQYQSRPARIEVLEWIVAGKGELEALTERTNWVVSSKTEPDDRMWSDGSVDWVEQQQDTGLSIFLANWRWLQRTSEIEGRDEKETREESVMWRWTSEGSGELETREARDAEMRWRWRRGWKRVERQRLGKPRNPKWEWSRLRTIQDQ
jgi:hypothetical protein